MFPARWLVCLAAACAVAGQHHHHHHRTPHAAPTWPLYQNVTFFKLHSQGNQDGVLAYIFQHVGVTNKFYVELGFNAGEFNGGTGANTYVLHTYFGWRGLLLDGGHANAAINLHREFITPDNVVTLLQKYDVPAEPDYVSIDIDSVDLFIFLAMVHGGFRPRVVTIEYNANYPLDASMTCAPDACSTWQGDRAYGASLKAIDQAARASGYRIVTVVRGLDAVLVRDDVLAGAATHPLTHFADLTSIAMHSPSTPERRHQVIDFGVLQETGSLDAARAAAAAWLESHAGVI